MNIKQALLILAIVLGSLILVFLTLLALYRFAPGIFGINTTVAPKKEEKVEKRDEEELKTEPKVVLSRWQYDEWLQKSFNAYAVQMENQFLANYSKYLLDSLKRINDLFQESQKKIGNFSDSLLMLSNLLKAKEAELLKVLSQLQQKDREITELRGFIERQQESGKALTDSAKQIVYNTFAKIYENSDPREVAKIIELLDDRDALAILKAMNKKKAGKIIDMLKPERSAQILEASFK